MRIPSGDLAPARRRRRRGPGLPLLLALLLVAGLVGGALLLRRDDTGAASRESSRLAPGCPTPVHGTPVHAAALAAPALPAPGQVRLRLLNATARDGLGHTVGAALAARGFGVVSTGTDPHRLAGPARVVFGPGARPAATLLAAHVLGARLQPAPTAARGSVELLLGTSFVRLRTPAEVGVALRRPPLPATPAPRPRPASPRAVRPC